MIFNSIKYIVYIYIFIRLFMIFKYLISVVPQSVYMFNDVETRGSQDDYLTFPNLT